MECLGTQQPHNCLPDDDTDSDEPDDVDLSEWAVVEPEPNEANAAADYVDSAVSTEDSVLALAATIVLDGDGVAEIADVEAADPDVGMDGDQGCNETLRAEASAEFDEGDIAADAVTSSFVTDVHSEVEVVVCNAANAA